jgi:hypothetical protein
MARANAYHFFRGRNDFPDRYHERISSAQWKSLKREVIKQRGSRCQRFAAVFLAFEPHELTMAPRGESIPKPQDRADTYRRCTPLESDIR